VAQSAGILLFRKTGGTIEVLLVHPGGPFWARKDAGAWSIPKGEYLEGEDPWVAAQREFEEETGSSPPANPLPLGDVLQKAGKRITAFAAEGDLDAGLIRSNTFEMEWPPRSGRKQVFPEIDRAAWFSLAMAREKINPAQADLLDRLAERIE
jgi:predicted NUDIX family NTP pyrophosphohydrolase